MSKPAKTLRKKIYPTEQKEQEIVVHWLKLQHPRVLFCASAGGMRVSMRTAIKMKAAGYSKGFPDVFIYEPCGGKLGLAIELKRQKGGVVSNEQKDWINALISRGYSAYICYGAAEAINAITAYLDAKTH